MVLAWRIYVENKPEYLKQDYSYQEYEKSERDKYTSFKTFILDNLKNKFKLKDSKISTNQYNSQLGITSSQFEGPQVHIEKLVYNNKEYYQDSVFNKYTKYPEFTKFDIQTIVFDPDHRYLYKPDLRVQVIPPVPYQEKETKVQEFFKYLEGDNNTIKSYKTYTKQVFSIGDDSTIHIENINIDLWLTKFTVTIETEGWKGKVKLENGDEVDYNRSDREMNDQRLAPFRIILKVFPNVSDWFVNTGNAFDMKADMAVGAIYCMNINNMSKDDPNIGVTPKEFGVPLPLIKQDYYESMVSPAKLKDVEVTDKTIWNKPIYAELAFSNFGTYKKFLAQGRDDKISFDFIMPLFVRGSWDIKIPTEIVPEYKPTEPYHRKLFDFLVPKWGLKGFGRSISTVIYLVIGIIALSAFFPAILQNIISGILGIFRRK